MQECRVFVSAFYFDCLYNVANNVTLILFIYMSVVFSRPLDGYWKEFLLSYRNQTLHKAIEARLPPTEQERARSYHETAVRDANRQILIIIQALLYTTEESPRAESMDLEEEASLTEEERAILDDSYERPTSDQLFEGVR